MAYRIRKEHVWVGAVEDRPGALAEKLDALSRGGLNLEMIIARVEWSGRGMMFVSPLRTMEEIEVAELAGLQRADSELTLRIEGPNAKGLGAKITKILSDAKLSVIGYSAVALGPDSVTNVAFERDEDVERAREILETALNG